MKHVTSRKAHREWERGGREKTDDSSLQEEQKDNTVAGKFFFPCISKDLNGDLAGRSLSRNCCLLGEPEKLFRLL